MLSVDRATADAGSVDGEAHGDPEWWERWAARKRSWLAARPGVVRLQRLSMWTALMVVIVAFALSPGLRLVFRSYLPCWVLLVAWFLVVRTKTLTWSAAAKTFALGVPLAVLIALASRALAAAVGLDVDDHGSSIAIAGALEELLKLSPLALLCVVAPGRVRRFAVVDWLLLGLASGLAFQAFEDGLRRISHANRSGLAMLFTPADPWSEVTSGYPQYGWSLLAGWSDNGIGFYAGHHVFTGLVAVGIGLAVIAGRNARGPARAVRWLLPLGLWCVVAVAHAAYNATAYVGDALPAGETVFPSLLRWLWVFTAHGRLIGPLLLALAVVALLVDATRLRGGEPDAGPHPGGEWPAWSDRWARRLADRLATPANAHATVRLGSLIGRRAAMGAAFLAGVVGRDLHALVCSLGGGTDVDGRPRRVGRLAAVVGLSRGHRERASAAGVRGSRRSFRTAACFSWSAALVAGTAIAATLAEHLGMSVMVEGFWLAGLLDRLADWWSSLGPGGQLALSAGLAALVVLSGGSFALAMGLAGGATWAAEHGHGLADFTRDPAAASRSFLANLTPQQAVGYGLELLLQRLVPAGVGAGAGRVTRRTLDELLDDPAAYLRRRQGLLRDDRGSFRLGPDRWEDPVRRREWRARWEDRPTRPSRDPSIDNKPKGRREPIRSQDAPAVRRGKIRENESAQTLSEHGFRVEQRPDVPGPKNPDYLIEGEVFDNYAPSSGEARNVWMNVRKKVYKGQTERVVLNLDDSPLTVEDITAHFDAEKIPNLEEVIIVKDGEVFPFFP